MCVTGTKTKKEDFLGHCATTEEGGPDDKSHRRLLQEKRARAAAAEDFWSYRERVSNEQETKERAARLADSLLNHTLKNILADGIASVELYEQNGKRDYLHQAKLSMKRGMWWTRRRQSLFMVCQGTYRPKKEIVNLQNLLLECVNGREIERDWKECSLGLQVQTDPLLLSLAFENGISNAIKHNRPQSSNPLVIARVIPGSCDSNDNNGNPSSPSVLEVIIQNNATPGALFISEEVESRLFQEGMHGKITTISSDGIGLGHARMMAELLGGKVSLRQVGDVISYTIRVPTEWHLEEPTETPQPSPNGSRKRHLAPTVSPMEMLKGPKPIRGMFIDDSQIARKYAGKVLFPKILGMRDWLILGENQAQLNLCVSFATAMRPDIIIIDENLELLVRKDHGVSATETSASVATCVSGTQICQDLVKAKVGALLCIRSGNTSPDDVQKYIAAGAHCVICKSFDNKALTEPLIHAFQKLREEQKAREGGSFDPRNTAFPILLLD